MGAVFCTAVLPMTAMAADAYPGNRPIRLIVAYTPGGRADVVARSIASKITALTDWKIVVENRPGAGGNIGMALVANTVPDGLLLGLGQTANRSQRDQTGVSRLWNCRSRSW